MQSDSPKTTINRLIESLKKHKLDPNTPIWVDYFCLRQLQWDFLVGRIIELIGHIQFVIFQVDDKTSFWTRKVRRLQHHEAVSSPSCVAENSFEGLLLTRTQCLAAHLQPFPTLPYPHINN